MEERKENENPGLNVVPGEMMPPFVTTETTVKNEIQDNVTTELPEGEPETCSCEKDGSGGAKEPNKEEGVGRFIFDLIMVAAVIVLFVLHFCGGKKTEVPVVPEGTPGNGDIVYVNIDTINEQYKLVSLLTDSLEAEKQKQTTLFQKRQSALEQKLANYQRNMQSGQLTAQQAQYAEASLQQESQKLQADYAAAMEDFETRYTAALQQIADSLKAATVRINKKHNASFVFSYGNGGQMLCADPTKDITKEVLTELNKPFKNIKKKK